MFGKPKFDLGDVVKDKITGFSGVIVARTDYLTGCRRYSIQSKELKDNKPLDWQSFDEDSLIKIDEVKHEVKSKGGVAPKVEVFR